MRAPAALLALPLTAGCAIGMIAGERVEPTFAFCAAAAGSLALLAAIAAAIDDQPADAAAAVIVSALALGISLGATAARRAYEPTLLSWFQDAGRPQSVVLLEGRLREDAASTSAGVSVLVDVDCVMECRTGAAVRGGVRLSIAGQMAAASLPRWRAGRRVRVAATLREPSVYLNPGVPNERRALLRRGIALVGTVKSAAVLEVIAPGSRLDEWAAALRAWARSALNASVGRWSGRSAGVAAAIVIGDRTGLTPDDERRLQEAGTYHVIAISGGNIAILTLLVLVVLRRLRAPPRAAAAAAILLLVFYGRVATASASVDRAIAAAVVVLAGRLIDQRGSPLNVLAAAAVLGLAASPPAVFDPGFILSFGATLAILIGVPRVERAVASWPLPRWTRPGVALLAATWSAEVALLPVSAVLFARVTAAGLLLNFAAIPLMTIVQAGALASLGLGAIALGFSSVPAYGVHLAARGLIDSAHIVEAVPWLVREVSPCAWGVVALYYAALVLSLCRGPSARGAALAAGLFGTVIVAGPHAAARDRVAPPAPRVLRVVFLDVGQGDSSLVVLPDRRAVLIDAGGLPAPPLQDPRDPQDGPAFDVGERVVGRVLRAFGVRALDTFVFTHPDPDHLGGGRAVLRSFAPRAVWEGVPVPPHAPRQLLRDVARARGLEWRTVTAGDRVEIAGLEIAVLHPPVPDWERQRVRNDDSVVLALRYGQVSVILPGDIGREGEQRTLAHLQPSALAILKAPHHGSATSSTMPFLTAVRPRAVIVSAGRNNRFGHPSPAVVERYHALGVEIFSTAEDGAVILDTDGESVEIRGWTGRRAYFGDGH